MKGKEAIEDVDDAFFYRATIIREKWGTLYQVLVVGMVEGLIRDNIGGRGSKGVVY